MARVARSEAPSGACTRPRLAVSGERGAAVARLRFAAVALLMAVLLPTQLAANDPLCGAATIAPVASSLPSWLSFLDWGDSGSTAEDPCSRLEDGAPVVCGDGCVAGTEQCDDGNQTDGDGCSATCERELPTLSRTIQGNQTSTSELDRWPSGEPYDARLAALKTDATGWAHSITPGAWADEDGRCEPVGAKREAHTLQEAATDVWAKALAGYLAKDGGDAFEKQARARLLEFAATTGFDRPGFRSPYGKGNQCVLDLSIAVWHLVEAATLLEAGGSAAWTSEDKWALQNWLQQHVFHRLTWVAANAANNWGPMAESASLAVADYLNGHRARLSMHDGSATTPSDWIAGVESRLARFVDAACHDAGAQFGWQASGALPDELRRGSSRRPPPGVADLCNSTDLSRVCDVACSCGAGFTYQQKATVGLVRVAEFERRKLGTTSLLYDRAPAPSIREAIEFVTTDPLGCVAVESVSAFGFVAAEYYRDADMAAAPLAGEAGIRGGRDLSYGAITHAEGIAHERTAAPVSTPRE